MMHFMTHLLATITVNATDVGAPSVSLGGVPKTVVNTLLEIAGALAVIFLIVGGLKYATSAGDSKRVESAKNTILYAIVGLVITILAYAIVNFVITKLN